MAAIAASVGVKVPSLYNHVAGLDDIRARVQANAMADLSADLQQAAMGRSGGDALRAMCATLRTFALRRPNRYVAMTRAPVDRVLWFEAAAGADRAVRAALRSFELDEEDVFAALVSLFATAHGFMSLEIGGAFVDDLGAALAEQLYGEAVERFIASLEPQPERAR